MGPYGVYALPGTRFIRLVKLETIPAPPPQILVNCFFQIVDLDSVDLPAFTALSYTWGLPFVESIGSIEERPATSTDGEVHIRENLNDFIFHILQTETPDQLFWIDSICINQADPDERSAQVSIMADIYSRANRVLVWLGKHDATSSLAFSLIKAFYTDIYNKSQASWAEFNQTSNPIRDSFRFAARLIRGSNFKATLTSEQLLSIRALYSRAWFRRLWVRQEVLLGTNVLAMCGDQVLYFEPVAFFAQYAIVHSLGLSIDRSVSPFGIPLETEFVTGLIAAMSLSKFSIARTVLDRHLYPGEINSPQQEACVILLSILEQNKSLNAFDPRDFVYVAIALTLRRSSALPPGWPTPDYTKSVSEVYTDLMTYFLTNVPHLHILLRCDQDKSRKLTGLPSWVNDFHSDTSISHSHSLLYNATRWWSNHVCKSHGRLSPATKVYQQILPVRLTAMVRLAVPTFSVQKRMLTVRGVLFDTICERSKRLSLYYILDLLAERQLESSCSVPALLDIVARLDPHDRRTLERPWLVFLKTIAGNKEEGQETDNGTTKATWHDLSFTLIRLVILHRILCYASRESTERDHTSFEFGCHPEISSELAELKQYVPRLWNLGDELETQINIVAQEVYSACGSCENLASEQKARRVMAHSSLLQNDAELLQSLFGRYQSDRSLLRTRSENSLGLGPDISQCGDEIWFLYGARVPAVLRPIWTEDGQSRYELLGRVYVHGVMDGEFFANNSFSGRIKEVVIQ